MAELLQDERAVAHGRSIADLRGATLRFTEQELQLAVNEVTAPGLTGKDWIVALVVTTPAQFRGASIYQRFASAYSRDEIFSDLEEARRWLIAQERHHA